MMAKVLIWDIETNGINARKSNLGWVICISYKWLGEEKVHCIKQTDFPRTFEKDIGNDKEVLKAFLPVVSEADLIVAHYGEYFDRPFVQGRLVANNLPSLPNSLKQVDTCLLARKHFNFSSNRLVALAEFLGLAEKKADKGWPDWWHQALRGNKSAVNKIAKYCDQDVRALEQVYLRLKPYFNSVGREHLGRDGIVCTKCGSGKAQKRGRYITTTNQYQRYQCQKCGGWFRNKKPLEKDQSEVRDL